MFFSQILQLDKFEGAHFKYKNTVFKFSSKTPKSGIFATKFRHFSFFLKFQGADLKYDNSIFNILPQKYTNKAHLAKNTQIGHFWSQIFAFLFFLQTFPLGKFEGVDFKYSDIVLKWLPKYTKMRHS